MRWLAIGLLCIGCAEEFLEVPRGELTPATPVGEWLMVGGCLQDGSPPVLNEPVCGLSRSLVQRADLHSRLRLDADGGFELTCVREDMAQGDFDMTCLENADCDQLIELLSLDAADCRPNPGLCICDVLHRNTQVIEGQWAREDDRLSLSAVDFEADLDWVLERRLAHDAGVFTRSTCHTTVDLPVALQRPDESSTRKFGLIESPTGFVGILPGAIRIQLDRDGALIDDPESLLGADAQADSPVLLRHDLIAMRQWDGARQHVMLWRPGQVPQMLATMPDLNGLTGTPVDDGFVLLWNARGFTYRLDLDDAGQPIGEPNARPRTAYAEPAYLTVGWDGQLGLLANQIHGQPATAPIEVSMYDGRIAPLNGRAKFGVLYHEAASRRPSLVLDVHAQDGGLQSHTVVAEGVGWFVGGQAIFEESQAFRLFWADDRDARSIGNADQWQRPREIYTQRFSAAGQSLGEPLRISHTSGQGTRLLAASQGRLGYAMLRWHDNQGLAFSQVGYHCLP